MNNQPSRLHRDLTTRIHEVVTWFNSNQCGEESTTGRSVALRPPRLPHTIFNPPESSAVDEKQMFRECSALVEEVANARSRMIHRPSTQAPNSSAEYNLALFQPHISTGFTLTQDPYGLISEHDEIGWDWWIGVHEPKKDTWMSYGIVCWIPPKWLSVAIEFIDFSPDGAISWIQPEEVCLAVSAPPPE